MLRKLKISTRLWTLIAVQVLILGIVAAVAVISLRAASESMASLNNNVADQREISRLSETVRTELLSAVNDLSLEAVAWEQSRQRIATARQSFDARWQQYLGKLSDDEAEFIADLHKSSLDDMGIVFDKLDELLAARDRTGLDAFLSREFSELVEPYFDALQARAGQQRSAAQRAFQAALLTNKRYLWSSGLIGLIGIVIAALLGVLIYRSIATPIEQIADTVHRVSSGDYDVRTDVSGSDELGELGQAFDHLLEDKVTTLAQAQRENGILNNSIIALLQAVFQLSQRDLTVHVPVTEDVTGPVADALNLLTSETSKVLRDVTQISVQVAETSSSVKTQSDKVIAMASDEHEQVEETANELQHAAQVMNQISELAQACNDAADNAIKTTQTALQTVTSTVEGIGHTHDTIRETEKRIKRLGERSQEISGIVNIINTIAERTHILAINASMHAAAAGEAGRGFAVVANEVQRLAENAREATAQIASLVNNIQTETADTVDTMNRAITQVMEDSQLAEQAGQQMQTTESTTAELVAAVQQIATSSQQQAKLSHELLLRAAQIRQSTQQTRQELEQQTVHTTNLVDYARRLVESVRIFKLPKPNNVRAGDTNTAPRAA